VTIKMIRDEFMDPGHDEHCESEFIHGPMAWSPCRCVERRLCTCPPPEAGGIVGVNRGHVLACPGLAWATQEERR
jgi:hypothetical protein